MTLPAKLLPLDNTRYKLAINSVLASAVPTSVAPTPVDALFQATVGTDTGGEGATSMLLWRARDIYPGGAFETQLVTPWLTSLGQSGAQITSSIAAIRAAALALIP